MAATVPGERAQGEPGDQERAQGEPGDQEGRGREASSLAHLMGTSKNW